MALTSIRTQNITKVLDLGTGSVAIGLSIAAECPQVKVILTDTSNDALEIAQKNAHNFSLNNYVMSLSNMATLTSLAMLI